LHRYAGGSSRNNIPPYALEYLESLTTEEFATLMASVPIGANVGGWLNDRSSRTDRLATWGQQIVIS
jgi:threonine/homoserine efflux transporter RhtA